MSWIGIILSVQKFGVLTLSFRAFFMLDLKERGILMVRDVFERGSRGFESMLELLKEFIV
jgi:hypothetical protein